MILLLSIGLACLEVLFSGWAFIFVRGQVTFQCVISFVLEMTVHFLEWLLGQRVAGFGFVFVLLVLRLKEFRLIQVFVVSFWILGLLFTSNPFKTINSTFLSNPQVHISISSNSHSPTFSIQLSSLFPPITHSPSNYLLNILTSPNSQSLASPSPFIPVFSATVYVQSSIINHSDLIHTLPITTIIQFV